MNRKEKTAEAFLKKTKELGITLKLEGNWIKATPPNKMSTQMLIELAQCPNEIEALIRHQAVSHD